MHLASKPCRLALASLWLLLLLGCQDESAGTGEPAAQDGAAPAVAPAVGREQKFEWYLESTTPGGESVIVRTGDGRITNESFLHWNNREYTLHGETQLDENGMVISQSLTGTSAFGATIDESFSYRDGVATWRTPGEGGSLKTDEPAFYVPNEWAAIGTLEALVRAAAARIDKEVPLFPNGSAQVQKVAESAVQGAEGSVPIALYAVSGLAFTPVYAWFDEDMQLAAISNAGFGTVREGWSPAILKELAAIQMAANADHLQELSTALTRRVPGPVVIEDVNVVDVVAGRVLEHRHVLLEGGKIRRVDSEPVTDAVTMRIDGRGKYLMPGLWDMHAHFDLADGILNIAGGVTSVRDMGNEHDQLMELTRKFDAGEVIGPHTYRAGFMDAAGPYAAGWAAETLDDALGRVEFFAQHGYIQIKLYSSIKPEWVAPIAARAHELGLRVSGHIPAFMSADQAIRAGYDEIQHINMVFLNFLAGDREDTRKQLRFTLYGDEAGNLDLGSDDVQRFFDLLAEHEVVIDPTAAIFQTQLLHHSGDPDPTFAPIIDHLPPGVARPMYNPEMDMGDHVAAWARSEERQAQMLKALHDRGIRLVAGSDNIPAFTLHRELEVYAEAGISNADVLRLATLGSADVVGVAEQTGSVEVGKAADLVLLAANPLADVSAVRTASLVVKGAAYYQPDRLYEAVGVRPFAPGEDLTATVTD